MQDEVGNQALAVVILDKIAKAVSQMGLRRELLSFLKSKIFKKLPEFKFSKVTLDLHLAGQGTRESLSRIVEMDTILYVRLNGRVQLMQGLLMLFFRIIQSLLHILEALLQRIHNL